MPSPNRVAQLPAPLSQAAREFAALFTGWSLGRWAFTIGGSVGKGNYDANSDLDFRLWHEADIPSPEGDPDRWRPYFELIERWKARGVVVDGVWPRRIDKIDAALRQWVTGLCQPPELEWTVWGYHLPADVFNQFILEDPDGVVAEWKRLLTPYPPALKAAVLSRHLGRLRYWRRDYHYANKVRRRDAVFLASLSARLVYDMMQVLFAINGAYYPGDGANLTFAERFALKPQDLSNRVTAALYCGSAEAEGVFSRQYDMLAALSDEIVAMADAATTAET
jgi:Domain of unknown function (DUF4037)